MYFDTASEQLRFIGLIKSLLIKWTISVFGVPPPQKNTSQPWQSEHHPAGGLVGRSEVIGPNEAVN